MPDRIHWGILGTATIATEQVIPALINTPFCSLRAIASRDAEKAEVVARKFQIPTSYGNYESLLKDEEIQAVYIPLPNHLHVEWAIKALRAGKHVLVEKPIALNQDEAKLLFQEVRKHPNLKVMEAFMYKFHPQWHKVKQMLNENEIGALKVVRSSFSFYEGNEQSIVNNKDFGGGSLMDVGCYPVSVARFLFEAEPRRVFANLEYHPDLKIDINACGCMEFEKGYATFFSSIRLFENQEVKLFGTKGTIELEIPFNPHLDRPAKIWLTRDGHKEEILIAPKNQYVLQVENFSKAILGKEALPFSLEDGITNMAVIDALVASDRLGRGVVPKTLELPPM